MNDTYSLTFPHINTEICVTYNDTSIFPKQVLFQIHTFNDTYMYLLFKNSFSYHFYMINISIFPFITFPMPIFLYLD